MVRKRLPFDFQKHDARVVEADMILNRKRTQGVDCRPLQVELDAQIFIIQANRLKDYEDEKSCNYPPR